MPDLTVTCPACKAVLSLNVPAGRAWFLCPRCRSGVPLQQDRPVVDDLEVAEGPEPQEAGEDELEEVSPDESGGRRGRRARGPRRGRRRGRGRPGMDEATRK